MNKIYVLLITIIYHLNNKINRFNTFVKSEFYSLKNNDFQKVIFGNTSNVILESKHSEIDIGVNTFIDGEIIVRNAAKLSIGKNCYIGINTRIWSSTSIKIGNNVLISHGVNIHDSNSHSLSAKSRRDEFNASILGSLCKINNSEIFMQPIVISDDVWLGFNSTIAKGVSIGRGSIVASNSFVNRDVPEYTIVAGIPAVIIGKSLE